MADLKITDGDAAALAREAALREQLTQHAIAIRDMNVTEAALREELASVTADRDQLKGIASAYIASDGAKDLRIAAAEQRNAFLEAQVLAKDAGIDFRDALINAVRMSSKELLMAWVPHDWEAKRQTLLSNATPTESGASE